MTVYGKVNPSIKPIHNTYTGKCILLALVYLFVGNFLSGKPLYQNRLWSIDYFKKNKLKHISIHNIILNLTTTPHMYKIKYFNLNYFCLKHKDQ